ncbi:MAG: hypothetical protein KJ771_03950, partial [Nanoarchaeota archaeon]|nr:hypothetical protein [Nanoarchaeota archaeon]
MKNKILICSLYILIFLVLLGTVTAASKPIAGFVLKYDNNPAQNATVIVYVNTTFASVNPCYILPSVYSGSDGSYATNLNNLKRNDTGSDCSGLWTTNDPIWAEADGSTVIPTPQGNGLTIGDTVASGTGLQYLSNVTLAFLDIYVPIITLISPENNNLSTTGKVVFEYNVTDYSNIANCSLIFSGTINETDTSVTRNITQNFTKTNLVDGIYNWSVNCTDTTGNENNSEFRILNVSKIGYLQSILITPTISTTVNKNDFFEFTVQVNCLGGSCGNVNASLDPIAHEQVEELSTWEKFKLFMDNVFSGDLITGLAAGALVPEIPSTPFWTNVSNPADLNDFSCLGNMNAGSSCNVTWYVNATGAIGLMEEFFAFFNSTTYTEISNETAHINITIWDLINPFVVDVNAAPSVINQTQMTNITANITDNIQVDTVLVNITFPNSTTNTYQMIQNGGDLWYYEFNTTVDHPTGTHLARIIANDTS